jgi:MFS family permease
MLIITYGLGVGLGMSMVYGTVTSHIVKFFPKQRGLAGGFATASYGISSVIIPPLANMLNNNFGVNTTFKLFGIVTFAVIVISSFFLGKLPTEKEKQSLQNTESERIQIQDRKWNTMLQSPVFYVMLFLLLCGAFSGLMVISQASGVAQNLIGMNAASAAIAVSVLALMNTCGRIIAGFISDKLGMVKTLAGVFIISIIGLILLSFEGNGTIVQFYCGISCVGLAFGSIMGVYPAFTAKQFGPKHNSVNYGIIFCGFALAGFCGPLILSSLTRISGSYQAAFLVGIAFAMCGALLTVIYNKITAKYTVYKK